MTLDTIAGRAAQGLRNATRVDTDASLRALRHLDRTRAARRGVAGATTAGLVIVAAAWVAVVQDRGGADLEPVEPMPSPAYPSLGAEYDVVDMALAPDGRHQAVATRREGMTSVVLVRAEGNDTFNVVWSSPTAHELGTRNPSWPAAVAWATDGASIALLVAQERGPVDDGEDLVDLSVVVVGSDGADRHVVEPDAGTCWCLSRLPSIAWTDEGRLSLTIPTGPDRGRHILEMS